MENFYMLSEAIMCRNKKLLTSQDMAEKRSPTRPFRCIKAQRNLDKENVLDRALPGASALITSLPETCSFFILSGVQKNTATMLVVSTVPTQTS
jgi:hypothetical protein